MAQTPKTQPISHAPLPHQHGENENSAALREPLMQIDNFQTVAEIFRQLSDTTRIRIFWLLCHCEECVINISALLEMSSPAVSHHLRELRTSGLVTSRREGKEVYYRAADNEQSGLLHQMIEKVMEITCPDTPEETVSGQPSEQELQIQEIHEYLMAHLDQRITIETLSRRYLMNPTTLKNGFKAVYGTSLAAHMREHRLQHAARLLVETGDSIEQIAGAVGYDTQSKFSAAFKEHFHETPREYRRSRKKD